MPLRPLQRILLVEDDPDIRVLARMALETVGGYTVHICSSGEEALNRAPEWKPDLIILDIMMPGMDGPTTLEELRRIPAMKGIPAVFMTAKAQDDIGAVRSRADVIGVISKPFDPMTLARGVGEIWENQGPRSGEGAEIGNPGS